VSVHETGRRLRIKDGPVSLQAWLDSEGKIAISNALFGLRLSPEDLRTVLAELSPATAGEQSVTLHGEEWRRALVILDSTQSTHAASGAEGRGLADAIRRQLRLCTVCGGPLESEDNGPECDDTGCPGRCSG
jgi:hypothetical protein